MKKDIALEPSVREGQLLNVKIEGVGAKGDGFFKHKGMVVFVKDVKKNEDVLVKIIKVLPKVAFGERIK